MTDISISATFVYNKYIAVIDAERGDDDVVEMGGADASSADSDT